MSNKTEALKNYFSGKINPDNLITDPLRTLAYGTDASFYRLIPQLVVKSEKENEVVEILKESRSRSIPLTFRAAGTSLSGQSITDSVLLRMGREWKGINVLDEGRKIRLQPGVIGAWANRSLAPFHRKMGPDPASINSATIGGIAANNASGMTSGTEFNIYNTLSGMKIIFSDGSILDSTSEKSREQFINSPGNIYSKIKELSARVKADKELANRIKHKYSIKNTTGFGLNSLVDFDDPFEIIPHLMIGSEGTLGFISEIELDTVPEPPCKATALLLFRDIRSACAAIPVMRELPVKAAEIMDRAALRAVENKPGMPDNLKTLPEEAAALLIETSDYDYDKLDKHVAAITSAMSDLGLLFPPEFTTDKILYQKLWDVRKGLFPSVCISRDPGTTVIIEDVNFPTERLADAALDLQAMFRKHNYTDTIIWGHSLAGNLHFVLSQDFSKPEELTRYREFIDDLASSVVEKYDGSLKAEHGTGRNMAPFVKYEWGEKAFDVMKEIKNIFDPDKVLNPGVILNEDQEVHLKNLKPLPVADEIVDKCIECGFCEINCPSRDLTLTPRQRITTYREISRLRRTGENDKLMNELADAFNYYGNQTCATDGLCELSCPVDIDTGKMIKKLRQIHVHGLQENLAYFIANRFAFVTGAMKFGLNIAGFFHMILGSKIMGGVAGLARKASFKTIPAWNKYLPSGGDKLINRRRIPADVEKAVVYFPSCIARSMGNPHIAEEDESQTTVIHRVIKRAGYKVIYPDNIKKLCCGMPFASKGFVRQGRMKSKELLNELNKASQNGKFPVLFDTSPCFYHFVKYLKEEGNQYNLEILEPIEFTLKYLADNLKFTKTNETITIHTTCSSKKSGLEEPFKKLADMLSENVIVPENIGCCGFAGDRGFSFPELNESALHDLKDSLPDECEHGYSTSKTCEIGLSLHSGRYYKSIMYLVDECSER